MTSCVFSGRGGGVTVSGGFGIVSIVSINDFASVWIISKILDSCAGVYARYGQSSQPSNFVVPT